MPSRRADILTIVLPTDLEDPRQLIEGLNRSILASNSSWFLLVDDQLDPSGRNEILDTLTTYANDHVDVIFADEIGWRPQRPLFKPSLVGPHTLLSYNAIGRPALLRREAVQSVGGFSISAGWAFEHDLYLRLQEHGKRFHHVEDLLPGRSRMSDERERQFSFDTVSVVKQAFERRGLRARVLAGQPSGVATWRIDLADPPPSVDIIIPTRDRIDLLRACISSIEDQSTYANYDIMILDNDSVEEESKQFFKSTKYRVLPCPGEFNYARIMNHGVAASTADFILTLNNDTEVLTSDWIEQLVGLASLDDVAIVGARLIDPTQRDEHDGVIIAPYPQHLRIGQNYPTGDEYGSSIRDVAAVTGAVQLVAREMWQRLGGMDDTLRVVMNDIDLCLRSQEDGKYVVFTPSVVLRHAARSSRGSLDPADDRTRFIQRWDLFGEFHDPFAPASLTLVGSEFRMR